MKRNPDARFDGDPNEGYACLCNIYSDVDGEYVDHERIKEDLKELVDQYFSRETFTGFSAQRSYGYDNIDVYYHESEEEEENDE